MALAYFTIDSWRLTTIEHKKAKIEQDYQSKIDQLTTINYNSEVVSSYKKAKYEAVAGRIKESNDEMTTLNSVFDKLSSRFNEAGLNRNEKTQLLTDMKYNLDRKADINKQISNEFKNIVEDFDKNDIFGFIQQFMDDYKEYISHLDANQIGCLANSIGFLIILSAVNSLVITYYGSVIINYFNFELKYPKLARFIRIRAKLADKLIKLNILYIYTIALIMLAVNLYIFLL